MVALLKRLGFTKVRSNGSHDHWEGRYADRRRLVTLDEPKSPYHRGLLNDILNQIGISKKDFWNQV